MTAPVSLHPHTPAQAGFLLWVGIDPDDRTPYAAEIIELAETLGELARDLLPAAETFTALSLDGSGSGSAPPADLSALRTRLAELEVIAHVPWTDDGPAAAVPELDVDLRPRVVIDLVARRVTTDGRVVRLTYKELELLAHLASAPGRVVPRAELLTSVWREQPLDGASRTIDVHVRRLREKLGMQAEIVTVRGAGYSFRPGPAVAVVGPADTATPP